MQKTFYVIEASYFNQPTQKLYVRYLNRGMFRDDFLDAKHFHTTYDEALGCLDFLMTNNRAAIRVYDQIRILKYTADVEKTIDLRNE